MTLETNIIFVFLGSVLAIIQFILIRNFIKSLVLTAFFASVIGGYKFYIQPVFQNLPLLPNFVLIIFGAYIITKGLIYGGVLFGYL